MLPDSMNTPKRILMTLDAVGGLWRYSVDLARCLAAEGIECVLVGFGPAPSEAQQRECRDLRNVALHMDPATARLDGGRRSLRSMRWAIRWLRSAASGMSISCI